MDVMAELGGNAGQAERITIAKPRMSCIGPAHRSQHLPPHWLPSVTHPHITRQEKSGESSSV